MGKGSALTRSGRRISVLAARAQRARTDRAFERLYSRYVQVVYRYALGVLRNPADAEDVTQTTFMNAFRAFRRGERPRAPERWLIKIAHNACRQRYRELARRPEEVPLSSEVLERLASSEEQRAGVAELLQALGGLSFDQRAALLMHELEGRSYAEIASTMGVAQKTVEMQIFRARRTLRRRRAAVQALGAVQAPFSLPFFEGTVGEGAAVAGVGVAAKVVAVVAATVVAGSAGYGAVKAVTPRHHAAPFASDRVAPAAAAAIDLSPRTDHPRRAAAPVPLVPAYHHRDAPLHDPQDAPSPPAPAASADAPAAALAAHTGAAPSSTPASPPPATARPLVPALPAVPQPPQPPTLPVLLPTLPVTAPTPTTPPIVTLPVAVPQQQLVSPAPLSLGG